MTGFQAFNESGVEIFNSNDKVLRAGGYAAATLSVSDYMQHIAITQDQNAGTEWAADSMSYAGSGAVQWFRAPLGKCICPFAGFIYGSTGVTYERLTGTPGQATGASGFLEVFSPTGEQVFSVAALAETPVIKGVISIPPNAGSGVMTFNTGFPAGSVPWICASASPGKYSTDGVVSDTWAYIYKFINAGTQVQVQSFNSPGIHSSLINGGFSVPLAYIPNYP